MCQLQGRCDVLLEVCTQKALDASSWTPTDVSRLCWSLAKVRHRGGGLYRRLSCAVEVAVSEYTVQQLSRVAWALAIVAPRDVSKHLFTTFSAEFVSGACEMRPATLAMVSWAYATIAHRNQPLFQAVAGACASRRQELNPQDLSNVAWSFAAVQFAEVPLLDIVADAVLARSAAFGAQDLAVITWAFASAGELRAPMMHTAGSRLSQLCLEPRHVSMTAWSFTVLRQVHEPLFALVGQTRPEEVLLWPWETVRMLCLALAHLPRMGAAFGGLARTSALAGSVGQAFLAHRQAGNITNCDLWMVHESMQAWSEGVRTDLRSRCAFETICDDATLLYDKIKAFLLASPLLLGLSPVVGLSACAASRYQDVMKSLEVASVGDTHTRRLLDSLRITETTAQFWQRGKLAVGARAGHGPRTGVQNWCFFHVRLEEGSVVVEAHGLANSTVTATVPDTSGLVAVQLHFDRVRHRSWDAEFRALASIIDSAREIRRRVPASPVSGVAQLFVTDVPCISCVGAMAQFRRRFPGISLSVSWDVRF